MTRFLFWLLGWTEPDPNCRSCGGEGWINYGLDSWRCECARVDR